MKRVLTMLLTCLLLLTMCHIVTFEKQHLSSNWRVRARVERPFMTNKKQKGVYIVKRGNQSLMYSNQHFDLLHQQISSSVVQCSRCTSDTHTFHSCPLQQCIYCLEFGHVKGHCKKNIR